MFEALLFFVEIHAQVSSVSLSLLDRVLGSLVERFLEHISICLQGVHRLSIEAMLRLTLEIEFFSMQIGDYMSPKAKDIMEAIFSAMESLVDRPVVMNGPQPDLKKILTAARKATLSQFVCLKKGIKQNANEMYQIHTK